MCLKLNGGLGLPNFAKYYLAAQLAHLAQHHTVLKPPLWLFLEEAKCNPLVVDNLLWLHPRERKFIINPLPKHYLALWDKLNSSCRFPPYPPFIFPLSYLFFLSRQGSSDLIPTMEITGPS